MQLTQLLSPQTVRQGVLASSKKRLMEIVCDIFATQQDKAQEKYPLLEALCDREKVGCTALGAGIALPHIKTEHVEAPTGIFLQLANGINYDAGDNKEVDLIFALFLPAENAQAYAPLLPEIAQKLTQKTLAKQLRNATSDDELWHIFDNLDQQTAQAPLTTETEA
ncbi:PTS sugar transporter subunit IIA [Pasteurellaceae bacterium 20609_3]|uniref:PTS sugar transporter subunit IIA n=1 Tax=Spirabiliibacterium mucosae TaxID=28156 RepID=UPI001AAD0A5B|nr:PTS sugar transporter subunit IIA [Spirabiliibacterium mucosae]MBE2898063.1 PTS sugar transporter subunit IIA [Spirabiliibacterium mucosae]